MRFDFMIKKSTSLLSPMGRYSSLNPNLSKRYSSDLSRLREEMTSRRLPLLRDDLSTRPSQLLNVTLSDFLPCRLSDARGHLLPFGHHLVYFPPYTRLSDLLPDGTDPMQSPGGLFTRRMWAGGSIRSFGSLKLGGRRFNCLERIGDVQIKGDGDDQKIFVEIERKIHHPIPAVQGSVRQYRTFIIETRTLVFISSDRARVSAQASQSRGKVLKPTQDPDFSLTLVPTPALLFRFSALTFNAHAIHLDKQYCREIEGHRNLLVHGPLSLIIMIEFLRRRIWTERECRSDQMAEHITGVEYRNLAPLYAEEEMKVCLKRKEGCRKHGSKGSWDVWVEGRDGGYAVKGRVDTMFLQDLRTWQLPSMEQHTD